MSNIRIHELAKQINKDNKEIIAFLQENGIEVKSHMSSVSEETVKFVKDAFAPKEEKKEEPVLTEQLKQYKELLDSGVITQEEFDAKKKQLLGL